MQAILGVIFHFLGGFASGSFYIPYKKVKGWNWESFWIIGGLFSWLIVPPLAAFFTIPDFFKIIEDSAVSTIAITYVMGLLWGIGGLTYGLGVRYLGVSLGSSIILGLCSFFGALIPAIYYYFYPESGKDTITDLFGNAWGLYVLGGLFICIVGIIICGIAGNLKDKDLAIHTTHSSGSEFKIGLGLLVAIISGVLSACFSFGIEAGNSMGLAANNIWKSQNPGQGEFLFRNNVIFVVILWGGLTTNLIWCFILNISNKSFGDYFKKGPPLLKNYILCAIGGTMWFLQFFFYGMGESKLGNGASSWILHMSFIILVANAWGVFMGEWSGVSSKAKLTIITGISVIVFSILLVGYGNSLKSN